MEENLKTILKDGRKWVNNGSTGGHPIVQGLYLEVQTLHLHHIDRLIQYDNIVDIQFEEESEKKRNQLIMEYVKKYPVLVNLYC